MVIKNLVVDTLLAALGPAAGFAAYGMASKKSRNVFVPVLAGGLAVAVGTFLAGYLQQKATGIAGLYDRTGGHTGLPSANMRERRRRDSGEPIYPRNFPNRGSQNTIPGTGTPQQSPYGTISALQMEAVRGMCKTCG